MKQILLTILILILMPAFASAQSDPTVKWKFTAKEGINSVYVGDLDNDGNVEIAATSSIDGMAYVLDSKGTIKWKDNLICPVSRVYASDLNNDGKKEVMVISCEYLTLFSSNGTEMWHIHSWGGLKDVYASDIDNDNFKEIIATISSSPYTNGISAVDVTGRKKWSFSMEEKPYSIQVADINNDNRKEIIVGATEKDERFFKPGHVYVLNSTGDLLWKSRIDGGVNYVSSADINDDGSEEILVGSYQKFYVLDKNGGVMWNYTTGGYTYDAIVADIDNDGSNEILIGANNLYVLDNKGNLKWKVNVGTEIYDMFVGDIGNDGNKEILAGSDRVYIFTPKGEIEWKSDELLAVRSVYAIDLDNDGFNEIIAGTLDKNLYVFDTANYAKTKLASSYYDRAQNFYTAKNYENASKYVRMAKSLYSEISNNNGISRSEMLISQIEKLSGKIAGYKGDADAFYKKAEDFYFSRNYLNASIYARMAVNKYTSVGDAEGVSKSESLVKNADMGLKADASGYYANAIAKSNSGDYDGGISDAKKARAFYLEIRLANDTLNVDLLIAGMYSKLAGKKYESNDFMDALKYAQNAKFIYLCVDSKASNCDPDNKPAAGIDLFVNRTYNESSYKEKLMQMDALIGKIGESGTVASNPADFIKIAAIAVISVILLYFGIGIVRKKKTRRKNLANLNNFQWKDKNARNPNESHSNDFSSELEPKALFGSELGRAPSGPQTENPFFGPTKDKDLQSKPFGLEEHIIPPSYSDNKIKNFSKKMIRDRSKGIGLPVRMRRK